MYNATPRDRFAAFIRGFDSVGWHPGSSKFLLVSLYVFFP